MSAEYTPTTEEIRQYIEVGGEPQPWSPPEPAKEAARVAAFDRWLAAHDAETRGQSLEEAARVAESARSWNYDRPADWTDAATVSNGTADHIATKIGALAEGADL